MRTVAAGREWRLLRFAYGCLGLQGVSHLADFVAAKPTLNLRCREAPGDRYRLPAATCRSSAPIEALEEGWSAIGHGEPSLLTIAMIAFICELDFLA